MGLKVSKPYGANDTYKSGSAIVDDQNFKVLERLSTNAFEGVEDRSRAVVNPHANRDSRHRISLAPRK